MEVFVRGLLFILVSFCFLLIIRVFHFGKLFSFCDFVNALFLGCLLFLSENFCFVVIFIVEKFGQYEGVAYLCRAFVLECFTSMHIDFLGQ